ncbi:MAG: NADH:flavin oxidoreductase/NADH oxidase [Dehalococcoidia bacterium]|nr:MAG: NADH:flavin oxidoreductase/NADH oxidase [Dehalococcoidia bacterium]
MSVLFTPIRLRDLEMRNRIWVSPMCEYSCEQQDGLANDWHLVHLGSRAVGGAGLVMTEATAVTPEGRISPYDLGIWSDAHAEALRSTARFIEEHGAAPAMQLAHAGRKASTERPWAGGKPVDASGGGWTPAGPSALPYAPGYPEPHAYTTAEVRGVIDAFATAAARAARVGFRAVEVHAAHGYLVHEFLSPLTNQRTDEYGGDFDGRTRLAIEVTRAVRESFPRELPVIVRISASEYVEGGWNLDDSVELACRLKAVGVDLIDCSSGGNLPQQQVRAYPGYQVPFARAIRERAGIASGAVGLITAPEQAEAIVASGEADVVLMGRELLRDPYWPLHAARTLRAEIEWPKQYLRAKLP